MFEKSQYVVVGLGALIGFFGMRWFLHDYEVTHPQPGYDSPSSRQTKSYRLAQSQALSNLRSIYIGMNLYGADYDNLYPYVPDSETAEVVTYPYTKSRTMWKSLNPNGGRIQFNINLAGVDSTTVPTPETTVLAFDSTSWPDHTRPVAMCFNRARFRLDEEWVQLLAKMKKQRLTHVGKPLTHRHP